MNRAIRRAFDQAAAALIAEFERTGPYPGQEVTPPVLAEVIRQCLETRRQMDAEELELPLEEVDELGSSALECLADMGLWAWQLKLDDHRAAIEDLALDMALWIAKQGGEITILEPAVNALAREADHTRDAEELNALFELACRLIAVVAPAITESCDL
ncbi:MAG: hypothetical protein ACO22T_10650, partial [Burkholderiales bacterium]